jgi:hypothetical protein
LWFIAFVVYGFHMNTECTRIAYQLASTINGEAWHGDSLREILNGITAEQALAHPVARAHSIWELVHHLDGWCKLACGAVHGTPIPKWPGMAKDEDWPPVTAKDEQAWQHAVQSMFASHLELVEAIKGFSDDRLGNKVPGRAYDFYYLFHGWNQHAVYHGGQIALLKKQFS